MSKVTVRNLTKKPIIFVLKHDEFCLKIGHCHCTSGSPASFHIASLGKVVKDAKICEAKSVEDSVLAKKILVTPVKEKKPVEKIGPKAKEKTTKSKPKNKSKNR